MLGDGRLAVIVMSMTTAETAPGRDVAGPPMALFDRVRDAVRDWRQQHPGD